MNLGTNAPGTLPTWVRTLQPGYERSTLRLRGRRSRRRLADPRLPGTTTPGPAAWDGVGAPRRIDVANPRPALEGFGGKLAGGGDLDGDGHADFISVARNGGVGVLRGAAAPTAAAWNGAAAPRRIDVTAVADDMVAGSP
jgi:hypothetical protein